MENRETIRRELDSQQKLLIRLHQAKAHAGVKESFQLELQIQETDAEIEDRQRRLASLDHTALRDALMTLNFTPQLKLFRQAVAQPGRCAGVFLIYGASPYHGQRWLLKRLVMRLHKDRRPQEGKGKQETPKYLSHNFGSALHGHSPDALWQELGGALSGGVLRSGSAEVVKQLLLNTLRTRDVVFTLLRCQELSPQHAQLLMSQLWQPLLTQLQNEPRPHRLWLFLLSDSLQVSDFGWGDQPQTADQAQPLGLPAIKALDADEAMRTMRLYRRS